jgi:hypothetical protein
MSRKLIMKRIKVEPCKFSECALFAAFALTDKWSLIRVSGKLRAKEVSRRHEDDKGVGIPRPWGAMHNREVGSVKLELTPYAPALGTIRELYGPGLKKLGVMLASIRELP